MGQCSGAYFVYFSLFFVNITVSLVSWQFPLTTLALGLGHATAAVSFYQLPVLQFSTVSCFFLFFLFCFLLISLANGNARNSLLMQR